MPQEFSVSLDRIIRENELETLYCPKNPEEITVSSNDVNRPGLQLGGFYEYFVSASAGRSHGHPAL